ncbi:pyruvate kinase [Gemella sp. zg-570]|nr:pyruvate kinase [Gemella sp. zg-1178]QWQ39551.1 pyruvate kinase [Gemella sp. zg-570]
MKRKVKVIATLGQSTDEKLENILKNKLADAVLIDNYYGSREENSARIKKVKELSKENNIAIIYDLDHIYAENKYKLIKIDLDNVYYAINEDVDFVATPFISDIDEIINIRNIFKQRNSNIGLIVKIDSKNAYENIDDILENCDAIMINRDELGMDLPLQDLPIIQKEIIRKANFAGKEVILTTQMLQSMVYNPRPTRAEVSDVANATIDGVDAILLIEETATGYYPEKSLETLNRIVCHIDKSYGNEKESELYKIADMELSHAMCLTSKYLIEQTNTRNIVTYTKSGKTARFIAKYRPKATILAIVPDNKSAKKLSLTWGVYTDIEDKKLTMEEMIEKAPVFSKNNNLSSEGDYVLVTLGGDSKQGNFSPTDFLTIKEVK